MEEKFGIKGKIEYELRDENGNLKDSGLIGNTITNVMDAHVADQMSDQGDAQIGFMALGSGTGQTASSTDLANFINIAALSGTGPVQGAGGDDNDVIYSGYWGAGEATNDSISEAGVFQASGTSRTTLCTYNDGLSINKGANDTLKIDWTVTFGAS
jgi:hypothetical protein